MQAVYGSDVRRAVEFEHGGSNASGLNWYLAGNLFAEQGWRDDSPVRRPPGCSARSAGRISEDEITLDRVVREQLARRERAAGAALPRPRLRERVHQARHHRQPGRVPQRHRAAHRTAQRHLRQHFLSPHPHGRVQRRHQRGLARSGRLSAGPADRAPSPTPVTRASRRAARPPPIRRFPFWRCIGTRSCATSPGRSATGSSTAPKPISTTMAEPGRSS